MGCWKDSVFGRAIPTIEGQHDLLDGEYQQRENAIEKCGQAAESQGYSVFALQHGGWCAASANAEATYKTYGESAACEKDGEGGPEANRVYKTRKVQQRAAFNTGLTK